MMRNAWLGWMIPALMLLVSASAVGAAAEEAAGSGSESFASILDAHVKTGVKQVRAYIEAHPDAADVAQAYRWLFETAREHGMEADVVDVASQYLRQDDLSEAQALAALRIRSLGLAEQGDMEGALADFDRQLRAVRLRSPNDAVDFSLALVARAQVAGDLDAASEILQRLQRAFFLNPGVSEMCETRLAKLSLVGKAAPELRVDDLSGNPQRLSDLEGKVVLLDFWATNCPPCLEEFPQMKQVYADFHDKGFEVVGISLDDRVETIEEFQDSWKLPWPLVFDLNELDRLRGDYHVITIPTTYLIDQQGRVAYADVRGRDLRRAVEKLLK